MKYIFLLLFSAVCYFNGQAQSAFKEHQFSFGIGAAFDYNNCLFPKFKEKEVKPVYYANNWEEDPVITGRMLSFSWLAKAYDFPFFMSYYKGEFKEQYSDPLMINSDNVFDRLYHSITLGSYLDLLKKRARFQMTFSYGLNFYHVYSSIGSYIIEQDDDGSYIGRSVFVEKLRESNVTLYSSLAFNYYSKNEHVAIGLKLSGFGQVTSRQNFTSWAIMPTISYKL